MSGDTDNGALHAFEAQRRFIANASHELRTPLTRERALVQVALGDPSTSDLWRSTGRELLTSNREQETLIDALLTLASSEGGLDRHERADLADIGRSVLARPGLDLLGLHVETALHPAPLDGDPRLVERLVANLVDNAIGHNLAGGRVRIETDTVDGRAVLTVSNSGPIVPPGEIERLFQPFQRLDPRRVHGNGHGLGLSIVRAIAAAHGATIGAEPLPEGGLSFSAVFPPPTPPPSGLVEPGGRNPWQPVANRLGSKTASTDRQALTTHGKGPDVDGQEGSNRLLTGSQPVRLLCAWRRRSSLDWQHPLAICRDFQ
jgi:signal transduction histidine kinase